MKKSIALLVVALFVLVSLSFLGCKKSDFEIVEANMSEITDYYFYGQSEGARASISVGRREKPYVKDGIHRKECEFSLISLAINNSNLGLRQNVNVKVNNEVREIVMELIGNSYMFDLEYKLNQEDKVEISFDSTVINLTLQNFEISSQRALVIGAHNFRVEISNALKENLFGECYLRVLGEVGSDFEDLYWCFTFLDRNLKAYNCIFDVHSGEIVS